MGTVKKPTKSGNATSKIFPLQAWVVVYSKVYVVKAPAVLLATVTVCDVIDCETKKSVNARVNLIAVFKKVFFIVANSMLIMWGLL